MSIPKPTPEQLEACCAKLTRTIPDRALTKSELKRLAAQGVELPFETDPGSVPGTDDTETDTEE